MRIIGFPVRVPDRSTVQYIHYITYIHCIHTYIAYIHTLNILHTYIHYIHTYTHTYITYIHIYIHTLHTCIHCIHTYIAYITYILSRALLGNATTINVDSSDLTRKFIGTMVEITRNSYNTLSRI
jgi:hypothetical protein